MGASDPTNDLCALFWCDRCPVWRRCGRGLACCGNILYGSNTYKTNLMACGFVRHTSCACLTPIPGI